MVIISGNIVKEAVNSLCFAANTRLGAEIYDALLNAYENSAGEEKDILKSILQNAKTAYITKKPLCQDTGQVIVFVKIGQNVRLEGELLSEAINSGISECYKKNFFRKSVVKNAVFDRTNTKTNTPAIIYTDIVKGDEIRISVLIKGAGSENKSAVSMLLPSSNEEEIIKECAKIVSAAGLSACPPMFIGIGIGGTFDKAAVASKEVFVSDDFSENENALAEKIRNYINNNAPCGLKNYVLGVKLRAFPTHIACMPVAVTINCHSDRFASCVIKGKNIEYIGETPDYTDFNGDSNTAKEIKTDDISAIKSLKPGEKILLTGTIYVARDAAHKKLSEMLKNGEKLPFDLKDKIIFYAGPCPAKPGEVSGSIGPTTASRMDKFCEMTYSQGVIATIGKGERSKETKAVIENFGGRYFTATGGIAALLSEKILKSEIIAFPELGAEAIYKLEIKNFPVKTVV